MGSLIDAAVEYHRRGFSLVPFMAIPPAKGSVKWKKKPLVQWRDRQTKALDEKALLSELKRFPNALLGVVTGTVSGVCHLDIDSEAGKALADDLVPHTLLVPTYKTMSGGLQMVFQNPEPTIPGAVRFLPDLDFRGEGSLAILPPSSNGKGGDYSWLPGLSIFEVDPPCMPSELKRALYNKGILYKGEPSPVTPVTKMFTEGRRDNDLFHLANVLTKGGMPEHEISQVLENLILSWGEKPDQKWIRDKIESAQKRDSRRSGDVTKAIEEWVSVTDGYFSVTDCRNALQTVTDSGQTTFRGILHRLAKRGIIEKHGAKDGVYRRINSEIEPLDWKNADTSPLNLRWPFEIEKLVRVYPSNIAVIAGAPNAGKTSFILNFIRLNQQNHEVHLFSSEGGKEELRLRISKFGLPLDSWTFHAWDRSGVFADVIRPNAINIIDYLEVHEDFYRVGGMLKAISDKLQNGFCLIALQKNFGRDEGLGGARGLEKPRLYMAMEAGRLKIVKGKSWATRDKNPNGLTVDFKLVDGCHFITESVWRVRQ